MISYEPMFETMKQKGITTYYLYQHGIDKKTIYRIKHGENITLAMIERICLLLDCELQDVTKIIRE